MIRILSASLALDKTASLLSPVVKDRLNARFYVRNHIRPACGASSVECLGLETVLVWGEGVFVLHNAVLQSRREIYKKCSVIG